MVITMGKSNQTPQTMKERNEERIKKAERYTANKNPVSQAWGVAHAKMGNLADNTVSFAGGSWGSAAVGVLFGAVKGLAIGFLVAATLGWALPLTAGSIMAITIVGLSLREGYEFFYRAENRPASIKAKKIGDKIAASGKGQAPEPKQKNLGKAIEAARKEMPVKEMKDMQFIDRTEDKETGEYWRKSVVAPEDQSKVQERA